MSAMDSHHVLAHTALRSVVNPSPFVKWAGGKSQLLRQYQPHIPPTFRRYHEPFVGGGAFFFHLFGHGLLQGRQAFLSDSLEDLVNCYRVIQRSVEDLIAALRRHERHEGDEKYYYEVRAWDRRQSYALLSDVDRAARCIFLNRTCYNGLYRVNQRGQFNAPFGDHKRPRICDSDNLRAVSLSLKGVKLNRGDFGQCLAAAGSGDFVYLDPPYHPVSDTANFANYTSQSFGAEDQVRLAEIFRDLDGRGCRLMLSNSDTPLIRELYQGYEQIQVRALRAINSKGNGRGAVTELLILNRYDVRGDGG